MTFWKSLLTRGGGRGFLLFFIAWPFTHLDNFLKNPHYVAWPFTQRHFEVFWRQQEKVSGVRCKGSPKSCWSGKFSDLSEILQLLQIFSSDLIGKISTFSTRRMNKISEFSKKLEVENFPISMKTFLYFKFSNSSDFRRKFSDLSKLKIFRFIR